jgi:hypothetical protein
MRHIINSENMKRTILSFFLLIAVFTSVADQLVYTPALKSPADNAVRQMPNVAITWYAITGTTGLQYELMFDTSASFNSPLRFDTIQTLLTGYSTKNLLFGTVYHWKVRAIDNGNTSAWSPVRSFTVFNDLECNLPVIGDTTQNPNATISWKSTLNFVTITGVSNYDFEIDTTTGFNSPLFVSGSVVGNVFSFRNANLRFHTTYYWRARPRHAAGSGAWQATPWNFKIISRPTLSAPANNAVNQNLDATLKWNVVTGILGYEYVIATDQNFTNIVDISSTDTIVAKADFLTFGGSYYWKVRTRTLTDTSQYSQAFHFSTYSTVIMTSPANNAQNVAFKPLLQWTAQTGITGYELLLDSVNTFASPIVSYKPKAKDASYQVTKKLLPLKTYYWKMRAFDGAGVTADTSAWSPVWSFTITDVTGIDEQSLPVFTFYPNPASGKLFIRIDAKEVSSTPLAIFDLLGNKVLEKQLNLTVGRNIEEINLDNLGKGIYIARLTIDGNPVNQKIVVQK